jgi:hypothetical protein
VLRFSRDEARHGFLIPISGEVEWLLLDAGASGARLGDSSRRFHGGLSEGGPAARRVLQFPGSMAKDPAG